MFLQIVIPGKQDLKWSLGCRAFIRLYRWDQHLWKRVGGIDQDTGRSAVVMKEQ